MHGTVLSIVKRRGGEAVPSPVGLRSRYPAGGAASGQSCLFVTQRPAGSYSESGADPDSKRIGLSIGWILLVFTLGSVFGPTARSVAAQSSQLSARALVSHGQEAMAKGDWKAAEEAYQAALRLTPRSASIHAHLGSAQIRLGKLQDAEKSFTEAIHLEPQQPLFRMGLAGIYLRQARFEAAAREYTTVIDLDPASFDAHYNLGLVFLKQKACRQAIAQLERADELSSSLPEVAVNLVDAWFCAGNPAKAVMKAEYVRRQWQDSPKVLYSLGLTLFRNGSYESANEVLARAWELHPGETEIGLQLARCRLALHAFREALDALLELRTTIPPTEEIELLSGYSYLGLGDDESAIQAFRQAVRLNPHSAAAQSALGRQLFQRADLEGSIGHLREAHRLAPSDLGIVTSLAHVLVNGGRFEDAIELLERHATDPSGPAEIFSLLAAAYASMGRFSSAVPMLEAVTHRLPENDRAHFLLGYARAELGQGKEALSAYETAIRLNPRAAVYYNHYASLLERQGKLAQAEESLLKSLALEPDSPVTHYGLGRILTQMGKYEEAIAHLQKSTAAGQPQSRAYYLLASCYARLGDTSRAKEYRDKFAQMATQSHREEYINLSGDIEALSFGRSQFALPPSARPRP